jgi:hypothetical protein
MSQSAYCMECTSRQRSLDCRGALSAWRPEPQSGASTGAQPAQFSHHYDFSVSAFSFPISPLTLTFRSPPFRQTQGPELAEGLSGLRSRKVGLIYPDSVGLTRIGQSRSADSFVAKNSSRNALIYLDRIGFTRIGRSRSAVSYPFQASIRHARPEFPSSTPTRTGLIYLYRVARTLTFRSLPIFGTLRSRRIHLDRVGLTPARPPRSAPTAGRPQPDSRPPNLALLGLINLDCGSCRYAVGAAAPVQGRSRVVHSLGRTPTFRSPLIFGTLRSRRIGLITLIRFDPTSTRPQWPGTCPPFLLLLRLFAAIPPPIQFGLIALIEAPASKQRAEPTAFSPPRRAQSRDHPFTLSPCHALSPFLSR